LPVLKVIPSKTFWADTFLCAPAQLQEERRGGRQPRRDGPEGNQKSPQRRAFLICFCT
jgi:hypothetical protein